MKILPSRTGRNPVSPPLRSAWSMIEETLGQVRGVVFPRIEWFRVWFRLRRVARRKAHLLARLGEFAAGTGLADYWPNTGNHHPKMAALTERIRETERLETHLRDWMEYLEDREASGLMARLQEDLSRRTVFPQTIVVTPDSPYLGLSINDIRKTATAEGSIPLTALRGNLSVELGPRLPLMAGDRLVLLSAWKKLREIPPSSGLLKLDGSPDVGSGLS
ncbi:MAG: TrkA C-terminal domain-containing protein [Nitrospirae bacterium]|nr:TrkA C-terminal domain-containing protein [Nitrospirota bacterium]MCL5285067.1 TrkA C-terminal domain-containing protein [Nitrospirota bacterium]